VNSVTRSSWDERIEEVCQVTRWFRFVWMFGFTALMSVAAVGTTTGCSGGDDCLPEGNNCSDSYLEKNDKEGWTCCDDNECCYLPNGITVPTCNPSHRCK
jgi:hypothetical protein